MGWYDTTWYVNAGDQATTGHYAVTKWSASTAIAAGALRRQLAVPAVNSERVFVCIVAGTTGGTEPAWTLTRGAKTTDGTVTWMEVTGASAVNGDAVNTPTYATILPGSNNVSLGVIFKRANGASYQIATVSGFSSSNNEPAGLSDTAGVSTVDGGITWISLGPPSAYPGGVAPHARITTACANNWLLAGNTVYIADNHAESAGQTQITPTNGNITTTQKFICHNHAGSYPPTAADMMTTAKITATAGTNILFFNGSPTGGYYFSGINFFSDGFLTGFGFYAPGGSYVIYDRCSFQFTYNGNSTANLSSNSIYIFNNTTMKFATNGQGIQPVGSNFIWQNTAPILLAGSAIPIVNLINSGSSSGGSVLFEALDLSQLTNPVASDVGSTTSVVIKDCTMNPAVTSFPVVGSPCTVQQFIRADGTARPYVSSRYAYEGNEVTQTSITRVGGAVDPTGQAQSRRIFTAANAQWLRPFRAEPYAIWNAKVGAAVTVTVCGIINTGALPNNDDIFMEVEYLSSPSSPLGKIVSSSKSNVLAVGAPVAADGSSWNNVALATLNEVTAIYTTVTNGNRTAIHTNTNGTHGAYSTDFRTTGKYYFEIAATVMNVSGGWNDMVGAITSNGSIAGMSSIANCLTMMSASGQMYNQGSAFGSAMGAFVAGDVICVAVDLTARLGWMRKNGGLWIASATANPATGVGGATLYPTVGYAPVIWFNNSSAVGSRYDLNAGQSAYAFTPPSGFGNFPGVWTPFKLTTTLNSPQPGLPGYIHARVRAAKPNSIYYIDPQITLS